MPKSEKQQRPSAVDLFSGAGGLSLGLEQAGFDVVAAVEYDPVHMATHEFNFPNSAPLCASVANVTGNQLRALTGLDEIDLVAGGPPCQGFSLIGHRALEDERNHLVFEYFRIVKELRPRYFIMENVPGMKVGEQAGLLGELIERFSKELGYKCRPVELLTATYFGVPQSRTRLFLVGAREGENMPGVPLPTSAPRKFKADLTHGLDLPPCPTVGDALADIPDADLFDELANSDSVSVKFSNPSPYAARMRRIEPDDSDYSYVRIWDPEQLTSSSRTKHTEKSVNRFAATEPGQTESISRFLRLDPDGYCNTLRAGTDSKRGAHTSPRPIHPLHPRVITVREAARLHSMPDWFRLHSTKWHGFRQVGNAVVPLVGRAVGATIVGAMGMQPTVPSERIELGHPELLSMSVSEAADHFGVPRDVIGQRDRKPSKR